MDKIIDEIIKERNRQLYKFGYPEVTIHQYFTILSEEVGEVAKELINDFRGQEQFYINYDAVQKELIQVATVCVAMVEYIRRREL